MLNWNGFRAIAILLTAFAAQLCGKSAHAAGPVVYVGAKVPQQQRIPVERIDHRSWSALLEKFVDERGMVAYKDWQASAAAQRDLDQYLVHLSAAKISRESDARAVMAYWINVYNAVTVKGILREYPTTSIRNHTAKLLGYNIWKDLQIYVDGAAYSLDDVEHKVLRKLGDPRIHFAIVCASIGCPRLLNKAYFPDQLDEQLTANAKHFFADDSKFKVDAARAIIYISPIMDWFASDFGRNQAEQLRTIAPYLPDQQARRLAESGRATVKLLEYDWGINDR